MGRNKEIRKKINSHSLVIADHILKIEEELRKPRPRIWLIDVWRKHMNNALIQRTKLERKLRS